MDGKCWITSQRLHSSPDVGFQSQPRHSTTKLGRLGGNHSEDSPELDKDRNTSNAEESKLGRPRVRLADGGLAGLKNVCGELVPITSSVL